MSPECQKKHNRTLGGIALASNIDPEMFEIGMRVTASKPFSSPWNLDKEKLFAEDVTEMLVEKAGPSPGENAFGGKLAVYTKREKDNKIGIIFSTKNTF